MKHPIRFDLADILRILPHRPPFLFVDRVTAFKPEHSILAERTLDPVEPQFQGHFPGQPLMPGVLVTEALAQTAGLLLGLSDQTVSQRAPEAPPMFYLAANQMKYTHPARPGDVLQLRAESDRHFGGLFRFNVEATVGRHLISSGSLTLARVEAAV